MVSRAPLPLNSVLSLGETELKLKAISSADAVTLPPDPKGQQDAISVRDRLLESKHAAHRKDETSSAADGGGILESEFLPLLPDSARIAGDVVVPAPELKPEPAAGPAEDNPLQSIPPARKRELMSEMIDDDETSKQSVMDISRMLDETSDVDTPRSPRRPHRPTGRPMSREPDRTDERQGRQEGMYKASGEKAKPRKGQSGERGAVKRSEGTGGPLPKVKNIEELEGRQLLRFEVGRIVARGRIGVVFRARDLENDLSVALKILHPGVMKDESEARRFVRAVNTMIGIRHENLVTLYSAGKSGPFCWMASEYVEGENLEEVIGRVGIGGMLPWEQPLRIMTHVARALEVAHRHKIVHRNVTPRSILIRISDGAAKLGDLMLAKATSGTRAEQVTQAGETIGELSYLSPEQAGTGEALDGRTDIYNLGATIYAVLTGQPPIEGENLAQTLIKIQTVLPESPSKQNTSLPPEFERIVMRTLAKSPEDRYETSTALLADLKAVKNRYRVKFRQ
ncbi:MAG: hypothetical protein CMJ48_07500 [Planctomycetaceae bacterium]|nr:hypothetical protein [Planctomycetaceae bacterium]